MEYEETQVPPSLSYPTSGRQQRLEDRRIKEHTHTCMHAFTRGESLEWLKMTMSNIWAPDPNIRWQRRQAGSVGRGVVTCGSQKGRVQVSL